MAVGDVTRQPIARVTAESPYNALQHPRPYVMLFEARSGSTFLTSMLEQHPRVDASYEILPKWGEWVRVGKRRAEEQTASVRERFEAPAAGCEVRGFKTKLDDVMDPEGFRDLMRARSGRILLLRRRNRVKLVVSRIRGHRLAERTGDWALHDPDDAVGMVRIEPDHLQRVLERTQASLESLEGYVRSLRLPTLSLQYEDLQADPDEIRRSVFAFLGVEDHRIEGQTLKHTPDDLRLVLSNFDELHEHFASTPFQAMLEER